MELRYCSTAVFGKWEISTAGFKVKSVNYNLVLFKFILIRLEAERINTVQTFTRNIYEIRSNYLDAEVAVESDAIDVRKSSGRDSFTVEFIVHFLARKLRLQSGKLVVAVRGTDVLDTDFHLHDERLETIAARSPGHDFLNGNLGAIEGYELRRSIVQLGHDVAAAVYRYDFFPAGW